MQLSAEIDTFTHAETIVSAISNQLIGKDLFELHSLAVVESNDLATNTVTCDFRFTGDVDRDAVKDYILSQVRDHPQVKTWVLSANLSWHRCTHDDLSVKNCKTTEYFSWSK